MEMLQWIRELVSIAAGLAVIVGVGWGLKLARQIAKTKDATIEQKEATIAHLEKLQAPAVVAQLEKITGTLDTLVREKKQLEEEVQTGKDAAKKIALANMNAGRFMGVAEGLFEAGGIMDVLVRKAMLRSALAGTAIGIEIDAVVDKQRGIYKSLNAIVSGTMPTLSHKDAFLEEIRKTVQRAKDKQREDTLLP